MTEPNEQYAYFTICGDFDPSEITELVGVVPSESWLKGSMHPRSLMERSASRWSLHSRLDRSRPLEGHIADVIEQLDVRKEYFLALSSKYGGQMQLVGYFHTYYPGLHLGSTLISAVAAYGLSVDFDFYYLYSADREDT